MNIEKFVCDLKKAVKDPEWIIVEDNTLQLVTYRNLTLYFKDDKLITLTFNQPGISIEIDGEVIPDNLVSYCKKISKIGFKVKDLSKDVVELSQKSIEETLGKIK